MTLLSDLKLSLHRCSWAGGQISIGQCAKQDRFPASSFPLGWFPSIRWWGSHWCTEQSAHCCKLDSIGPSLDSKNLTISILRLFVAPVISFFHSKYFIAPKTNELWDFDSQFASWLVLIEAASSPMALALVFAKKHSNGSNLVLRSSYWCFGKGSDKCWCNTTE